MAQLSFIFETEIIKTEFIMYLFESNPLSVELN